MRAVDSEVYELLRFWENTLLLSVLNIFFQCNSIHFLCTGVAAEISEVASQNHRWYIFTFFWTYNVCVYNVYYAYYKLFGMQVVTYHLISSTRSRFRGSNEQEILFFSCLWNLLGTVFSTQEWRNKSNELNRIWTVL